MALKSPRNMHAAEFDYAVFVGRAYNTYGEDKSDSGQSRHGTVVTSYSCANDTLTLFSIANCGKSLQSFPASCGCSCITRKADVWAATSVLAPSNRTGPGRHNDEIRVMDFCIRGKRCCESTFLTVTRRFDVTRFSNDITC